MQRADWNCWRVAQRALQLQVEKLSVPPPGQSRGSEPKGSFCAAAAAVRLSDLEQTISSPCTWIFS